jgi:hypothetical protein
MKCILKQKKLAAHKDHFFDMPFQLPVFFSILGCFCQGCLVMNEERYTRDRTCRTNRWLFSCFLLESHTDIRRNTVAENTVIPNPIEDKRSQAVFIRKSAYIIYGYILLEHNLSPRVWNKQLFLPQNSSSKDSSKLKFLKLLELHNCTVPTDYLWSSRSRRWISLFHRPQRYML